MENLESKIPSGEVLDNGLDTTQDYLDTIAELRRNSVNKEDYYKLKEDNKKLLQAIANGETIELEAQKPVDVNEIRKRFLKAESSLDGISAALDLRDAIMAQGGRDPFLPAGKKIAPTDEDIATANKVAAGFRYCVDYADGDPHIFANELSRITADIGPVGRRKKK